MYTSQRTTRVTKIVVFVIAVAIPLVVGLISSHISGDLRAQYDAFTKPPLAPPNWLFGVVWPVLYLLMGIASYLIITADVPNLAKIQALSVYVLQLMANALWSPVFFKGDMLWGAVIVIAVLDLLVLATIMSFWRIKRTAALLLVPYLAWVAFATYLNVGFALVN